MSLMNLFFDRRRKSGGCVVRELEIEGVGRIALVRSVDCIGAMCPRPQLLTLKVVGEIRLGDVIEVLTDNPSAMEGFPALAQALNCEHLKTLGEPGYWRMYLRKG